MSSYSREPERSRWASSGATFTEVAISLFLFSIVLVSVAPLFLASAKSNEAANESTRANVFARDRLEQLATAEFRDPRLAPGFHGNDLPPTLPSPVTGGFPSPVRNPFRRTYRVTQFSIPDDDSVPRGGLFTPVVVRAAGVRCDFKRIDVTVEAERPRPGLGLLAVRVSAIRSNPSPEEILSEEDADP